jgi:RNA 2',3'-cyclic 3'-phosphodiesterase
MKPETPQAVRLFFALWPDPETRNAIHGLQSAMQGRRTPYQDLHLTVAFLGQRPVALVPALKEVLERLPQSEITIMLDRIGYFPRNRIAWAGMHATPQALLDVRGRLIASLAESGVECVDRNGYRPHVTLARDASLPPDPVFAPIRWHARQLALVQSRTGAEGARYEVLALRAMNESVRTPEPDGGTSLS